MEMGNASGNTLITILLTLLKRTNPENVAVSYLADLVQGIMDNKNVEPVELQTYIEKTKALFARLEGLKKELKFTKEQEGDIYQAIAILANFGVKHDDIVIILKIIKEKNKGKPFSYKQEVENEITSINESLIDNKKPESIFGTSLETGVSALYAKEQEVDHYSDSFTKGVISREFIKETLGRIDTSTKQFAQNIPKAKEHLQFLEEQQSNDELFREINATAEILNITPEVQSKRLREETIVQIRDLEAITGEDLQEPLTLSTPKENLNPTHSPPISYKTSTHPNAHSSPKPQTLENNDRMTSIERELQRQKALITNIINIINLNKLPTNAAEQNTQKGRSVAVGGDEFNRRMAMQNKHH